MEEKNTIGTNLFNIRNQKGETQEQVAESVGISYVSLSRYETGQRMPKMNILAKLADHYGVTIDSLIGTDTKKEPTASDALQLWAEVYCFIKGMTAAERATCFRLTPLEQAALAKRNGEYEAPIKAQPEVEEILSRGKEEGLLYKLMSVTAFKLAWPEYLKQYTPQQISKALKRCGVEVKHTMHGSGAELPLQQAAAIPFRKL